MGRGDTAAGKLQTWNRISLELFGKLHCRVARDDEKAQPEAATPHETFALLDREYRKPGPPAGPDPPGSCAFLFEISPRRPGQMRLATCAGCMCRLDNSKYGRPRTGMSGSESWGRPGRQGTSQRRGINNVLEDVSNALAAAPPASM